MVDAVGEEGRRARGAAGRCRGKVALDSLAVGLGVDLRRQPLGVETEVAANRDHRLPRESRLGREKGVVVLPEFALGASRLARLRRHRRQRVLLGNRQVAEGEDHAAAKPIVQPPQNRLGTEAEGALEVPEHHQLQLRPALAADVIDVLQWG